MKNIGSLLVLFGAGSIVLNLIGYEFSILMWIDNWGTSVGWGIRGGLAAVGAVLFFLGWKAEQDQPAEAEAQME